MKMRTVLIAVAFFAIIGINSIAAADTLILPCKSTIDQWEASLSALRPSTKTCQATVVKDRAKGECAREKTWECRDQFSGKIEICSECILWKTVSWKKRADVSCGGRILYSSSQTCVSSNSTPEKHDQAYSQYDLSIGSLIIELFSQQGFKVSTVKDYSNGSRYYFER